MNARERVWAALEGRQVDCLPFTMWRHFHLQAQTSEGLARATLNFHVQYQTDIVVLAPSPFYMAEGWGTDIRSFGSDGIPPYIAGPLVGHATAWRKLPSLNVRRSPLRREIEAVRQLRSALGEEDVPLILPLYSPLTTANMLCDGRIVEDMRSFSSDLRSGLGTIAAATCDLAQAYTEAGADGFFFIADLARSDILRTREYHDFGQSFDLQVLNELAQRGIRILYLGGERLFFDLADRYPIQAVCWETWRATPSLASAGRRVRCALMGGINPATFARGSIADISNQIADAISQTGGWHLIIAPTGPVPTDSREELLAVVRDVVNRLSG